MIEFQPGDRKRLDVTAVTSTALTTATVRLLVNATGTPVTCDWTGDQTQEKASYVRKAQTVPFFAGPEADAQPGDIILPAGATRIQVQVAVGGVTITRPREYIVCARTAVSEGAL
jgi:hypothetical protein